MDTSAWEERVKKRAPLPEEWRAVGWRRRQGRRSSPRPRGPQVETWRFLHPFAATAHGTRECFVSGSAPAAPGNHPWILYGCILDNVVSQTVHRWRTACSLIRCKIPSICVYLSGGTAGLLRLRLQQSVQKLRLGRRRKSAAGSEFPSLFTIALCRKLPSFGPRAAKVKGQTNCCVRLMLTLFDLNACTLSHSPTWSTGGGGGWILDWSAAPDSSQRQVLGADWSRGSSKSQVFSKNYQPKAKPGRFYFTKPKNIFYC